MKFIAVDDAVVRNILSRQLTTSPMYHMLSEFINADLQYAEVDLEEEIKQTTVQNRLAKLRLHIERLRLPITVVRRGSKIYLIRKHTDDVTP